MCVPEPAELKKIGRNDGLRGRIFGFEVFDSRLSTNRTESVLLLRQILRVEPKILQFSLLNARILIIEPC